MYGGNYRVRGGGNGGGYNGGGGDLQRQIQSIFFRGGVPFTMGLIATGVVYFLVALIAPLFALSLPLAFGTEAWPVLFWTVFTWPVVNLGLGAIFAFLWAWMVCGSLERSWGTRNFALFFVLTNALAALTLWVGNLLLHQTGHLIGMYQAVAASTVAWCVLNRREQIRLMGIIPVPAPLIGAASVLLLWLTAGSSPLMGLFALSGCGAAFWYANGGRYTGRVAPRTRAANLEMSRPRSPRPLDPEQVPPRFGLNIMAWWRDRQERKRLERIFRNSGYKGPDGR